MQNIKGAFLASTKVISSRAPLSPFTPIVATLGAAMQVTGFDFMSFDWKHLLSLGISAGIGYLIKNLLSTQDGSVFGVIG
jgi:hypothetical protein